jgi:hypothetical protein
MLNPTLSFGIFAAEQKLPRRSFRNAVLHVMVIGVGETLRPANATIAM